jgi:glycosyltransferase involved in cell wall biosynthesis
VAVAIRTGPSVPGNDPLPPSTAPSSPKVAPIPTSFGFLSTYPPTQCGLATFTASLRSEIAACGHGTGIARVLEHPAPTDPSILPVVHDDPVALIRGAAFLDRYDVAVVQHEFGIYAGPDGDSVVELLRRLSIPVIVVLHTVLTAPTAHQRQVLEAVASRANAVVTMTETARRRLAEHYDVDPTKVTVIPHGAPGAGGVAHVGRRDRPLILTWGLLGPGKGIERVIDALPSLSDLHPRYLVVGETHPRVLEREGDRYRHGLIARAARLGVADMVAFDDHYLDLDALRSVAATADVVVLPYDSREQVTSGVLIEAVTAGRPVIATAFPHAVELLGGGAGIVVDHDDPGALSRALRDVLSVPGLADRMGRHAALLAPGLLWPAVAARYVALAQTLTGATEVAVA